MTQAESAGNEPTEDHSINSNYSAKVDDCWKISQVMDVATNTAARGRLQSLWTSTVQIGSAAARAGHSEIVGWSLRRVEGDLKSLNATLEKARIVGLLEQSSV